MQARFFSKSDGMKLSRKDFVTAAAIGASASVLSPQSIAAAPSAQPSPRALHFHVLGLHEYDYAGMMRTLAQQRSHKQVFQVSGAILLAPGVASAYIHMQNSMNAHEFSLGYGRGSLATLAVLMGPPVILSLKDAMWTKYGFGSVFNLEQTNTYYRASSLRFSGDPDDANAIYQDWSAQAVMARGGAFMVCHNALTYVASIFASRSGQSTDAVLAEFTANMLPGYAMVPAGVAAVQLAQQHGWTLFAL